MDDAKYAIRAIRKSVANARKHCVSQAALDLDKCEKSLDAGDIAEARHCFMAAQAAQIYYGNKPVASA